MSDTRPYNQGDFVKYKGDQNVKSPLLIEPAICEIITFETFFDVERLYLRRVKDNQMIWSDYRQVVPIYTTRNVLLKYGFNEETNSETGVPRFKLDSLVLSSISFEDSFRKHHHQLGMCIGDLSSGFDEKPFMKNWGFDREAFYKVYPSVNNVNLLINSINRIGVDAGIGSLVENGKDFDTTE